MADISYTPEEAEAAAEALRYWFRLDTWTLREGLLLLVGIDPYRSECITIDENGKGFQFEGKGHPAPYWSRIGYPPDSSWTEEDMLAGRQPTITGLIFCPAEGYRLWELLNIWHANPELEGLRRARPLQFITLAESKGLAPYWLEAARAKGILPADAQKTPDMAKIGSRAPLIGSLTECSAWLAAQGVQRTPREILEDAAVGLLPVYVPTHEDATIPERVEGQTPERIKVMHALQGKNPEKTRAYCVRERKAKKGELIPVRREECLQFLSTGETSVFGPGFTCDDADLPGELPKLMKATIVLGIDAFKVQKEHAEQYADGLKGAQQIAPINRPPPLQRQQHQENEILRVLHELGHNPNSLPKNNPGKKGVKAAVRSRLKFSKGVFDKAWERLLAEEISYGSESH